MIRTLSKYKTYINIAVIIELALSSISIATTATNTTVAVTDIGIPYSIPTLFITATLCGSLFKVANSKI